MKAGRPVNILMRSMKMEVSLHSRIQSGIFEYLTNPTFSRHSRNKILTHRVCHIHVLHYAWRLSSVFSLTPSGGLLPLRPPVRLLVGTERASWPRGNAEREEDERLRHCRRRGRGRRAACPPSASGCAMAAWAPAAGGKGAASLAPKPKGTPTSKLRTRREGEWPKFGMAVQILR